MQASNCQNSPMQNKKIENDENRIKVSSSWTSLTYTEI